MNSHDPAKPMIRITRLDPPKYSRGLVLLRYELIENGKTVHNINGVSGQPGCQNFRKANDPLSRPGNMEPIPQGWYWSEPIVTAREELGVPIYNNGIGEWFGPLTPKVSMARGEFGFHMDYNHDSSPGTAGCPGIPFQDHGIIFRNWRQKFPKSRISVEVQWGL